MDPLEKKIERLGTGEQPRVLDLFSGCGGFMAGFQRAGCVSLGGVEIDELAAASYALNFHGATNGKLHEFHAAPKDIQELDPGELLRSYGHSAFRSAVDIIIGGPPCPTFTRVGRAKLREIHQHPEAFKQDPRWKLYIPYLSFVDALLPLVVVMENVPDILNFGGHNLAEEICDALEDSGYQCAYTLLNAASYGVPQMRERMFLIGIHRALGQTPQFPRPTYSVEFPSGYEGARDVALKEIRSRGLFDPEHRYVPPPKPEKDAPAPVTVEEAIKDLPAITGHLDGSIRRGARRFNDPLHYRSDVQPSAYAQNLKTWPGFEARSEILDHVTRSLSERDYRLFRRMRPGDDYPAAHKLAEQLFEAEIKRRRAHGERVQDSSPAYLKLKAEYVPPYDHTKFPNKWRKMEPDKPARTLMAHLGKDSYTHIHFDSSQARVISVREAARLQSFPDGFRFCGTMNPAFRQIGNAVPPLMAFALARSILGSLGLSIASLEQASPPSSTEIIDDSIRLVEAP